VPFARKYGAPSFRSEQHRRPGDIHVHFFGAAAFSSGDGIHMQEGDVMEIAFEGYGGTAESDSYCTESRTAAGSAAAVASDILMTQPHGCGSASKCMPPAEPRP